jgi:hypothetical protein
MDLSTAAQAYGALIGLDVCFGSKADIRTAKCHVRFTAESGRSAAVGCSVWIGKPPGQNEIMCA